MGVGLCAFVAIRHHSAIASSGAATSQCEWKDLRLSGEVFQCSFGATSFNSFGRFDRSNVLSSKGL